MNASKEIDSIFARADNLPYLRIDAHSGVLFSNASDFLGEVQSIIVDAESIGPGAIADMKDWMRMVDRRAEYQRKKIMEQIGQLAIELKTLRKIQNAVRRAGK